MKKLLSLDCGYNNIENLNFENNKDIADAVMSANPIAEGITFDGANNLRYVSVNETKLSADALNALYTSLREKRPEDDDNGIGGLLLLNDVENNAAKQSNTNIATQKGWMVTVEGTTSGIGKSNADSKITIKENAQGWTLTNIPSTVKSVELYSVNGKLLARYAVTNGTSQVYAPCKDVFMVKIGNTATYTLMK